MQQSIKDYYSGQTITVQYPNGEIALATIGGRLLPFAHVKWYDKQAIVGVEVAWETIVKAKLSDKPIKL